MSIGKNIRMYRQNKNLTLAALAKKIGTYSGTLSLIECGKRNPSVDMLKAISAALDVPIGTLTNSVSKNDNVSYIHNIHTALQNEKRVAVENVMDSLEVGDGFHELRDSGVVVVMKDDSMSAIIPKNTHVVISQEDANNGDLVAARSDHDLLIRRLLIIADKILLIPLAKTNKYPIVETTIENIIGKISGIYFHI